MTTYLTRGNIFWGVLLVALSSIDAFFTNYLLSTGMYQEANPLISLYANTSLYIKSAAWIPVAIGIIWISRRKVILTEVLIVCCVALTAICAWNAYQVGQL